MTLDAELLVSIKAREVDAGDVGTKVRITPVDYFLALTDGTGANQAQVVWSDSRTVGTTAENLSLLSLADTRNGAAVVVSFTAVKAVFVRNTHATNTLLIGGSLLGAFPGLPGVSFRQLSPGGVYLITSPSDAGFSVSSTLYEARFAGSGGTCTYDIVLIGEGTVT